MDAITEKQKTLIISNIIKACSDINKLNGTGYKYLYLANGFIAHYNLQGFKSYYSGQDLTRDILANQDSNKYLNFKPMDKLYHYYKSKADIYSRIVAILQTQKLNLWNS